MTVNASTLSINSLEIPSLSPWAEPELGTYIREKAAANNCLGRDITSVCWALSSHYTLALRRARFWCQCLQQFNHLLEFPNEQPRPEQSKASAKQKPAASRRRGGTYASESAVVGGSHESRDLPNLKRKDLLRQLGRTSMTLKVEGMELRIEWRIVHDWTGEAESELSAAARLPSICELHKLHVSSSTINY
jgi:hypothetical protein